jgi:Family of unknown function (DUF5372)
VSLGSLVVMHPFHPLRGRRLEVLLERRCGAGRVFVCERRRGRNVELAVDATDRGLVTGERPLSFGVLVGLAAVVAAIGGGKEMGPC